MPTISIKQLHAATGKWVRAARHEPVHVTDRGKLTAVLNSAVSSRSSPAVFQGRDWSKLPVSTVDATDLISADRDER